MQRKVKFLNLLTKAQVITTYAFAGMTLELLPRKGHKTIINVPEPNKIAIEITKDSRKGTYGDPLFLCEHCQYLSEVSQ